MQPKRTHYIARSRSAPALCASLAAALAAGCSDPDYTPENFEHFERLADRNGEAAIQELRYFVHHNPEHAEANLRLGTLLTQHHPSEERKLFLARHYIEEAMEHAEGSETYQEAQVAYMETRLRQDSAPGDVGTTLDLAEHATEHDRSLQAAELYLEAADGYIAQREFGSAMDPVEEALDLHEEHAGDAARESAEEWSRVHEQGRQAEITLAFLEEDFERAIRSLDRLESPGRTQAEHLPHPSLPGWAATTILRYQDGWLQVGSWLGDDDGDDDQISAQELAAELREADDTNRSIDNASRSDLSAQIWERVLEKVEGESEGLTELAGERLEHYEDDMTDADDERVAQD